MSMARQWRINVFASLAFASLAGAAVAQNPWQRNVQPKDKPVNALMRWVGFGYSDGYHAEPRRATHQDSSAQMGPPQGQMWQMWSTGPTGPQETRPTFEQGGRYYPSEMITPTGPTPAVHDNSTPQRQPTTVPPPNPQPSRTQPESLAPPQIEFPRPETQRSPSDLKPPAIEWAPGPPQLPSLPMPQPPPVVDPDSTGTGVKQPMQTRRRPYWWTR